MSHAIRLARPRPTPAELRAGAARWRAWYPGRPDMEAQAKRAEALAERREQESRKCV